MSNGDIIQAAVLLDVAADALAKLEGTKAKPLRNMYHEFLSPTADSLRTEAERLLKLANKGGGA